jgi:hypothetical protein
VNAPIKNELELKLKLRTRHMNKNATNAPPRRLSNATTSGAGAARQVQAKKGTRVSLETERRGSVGKEYLYKVLVVGCAGTGKTSLIHRTVDGHFSGLYKSTIGVDFALKSLERDQHKIFVQLWDIAGTCNATTITSLLLFVCCCFALTLHAHSSDGEGVLFVHTCKTNTMITPCTPLPFFLWWWWRRRRAARDPSHSLTR